MKIFYANISKVCRLYQNCSMNMLERVRENDHAPTVCAVGH